MKIAISQPMFLPWYGHFELMRHADIFVHYDDAQLPGGSSFMTRVQVKTTEKPTWLSLPIDRTHGSLRPINTTNIVNTLPWREKHTRTLSQVTSKYPHSKITHKLVDEIYNNPTCNLAEFNIFATETIASCIKLFPVFKKSSEICLHGRKNQGLLDICKKLNATEYISAHGGMNYINHNLFQDNGIEVKYMNYACTPYAQLFGNFTPFITILDMIAACGEQTIDHFHSEPLSWTKYDLPLKQLKQGGSHLR